MLYPQRGFHPDPDQRIRLFSDRRLAAGAQSGEPLPEACQNRLGAIDSLVVWKAALAYCEGLTMAGKSDWRLPSIKELATIVNDAATASPAVDQATFGASGAQRYWSSSPAFTATAPGWAFVLQVDLGVSPQWEMTNVASARCVRQAD